MTTTPDIRDIHNPPPTELWIGKADGEWPVHAFISEGHLRTYLVNGERRRAWKVEQFTLCEVELSPPVERTIRPVAPEGAEVHVPDDPDAGPCGKPGHGLGCTCDMPAEV